MGCPIRRSCVWGFWRELSCTISLMPKHKKTKHPQTKLFLRNNSEIEVDHEIQELIDIMNAPGLTTLNSCQNDRGTSYIQFRGKLAKPFMHALLTQLLNEKRHKPEHPICFANPKNPKYPNSFQIRWNPIDYDFLVRYARSTVDRL
jgi:hypothetical protein